MEITFWTESSGGGGDGVGENYDKTLARGGGAGKEMVCARIRIQSPVCIEKDSSVQFYR